MALSPLEISDRFSNEVKRCRLMLGMSYRTLAHAIGVSRTTFIYGKKVRLCQTLECYSD